MDGAEAEGRGSPVAADDAATLQHGEAVGEAPVHHWAEPIGYEQAKLWRDALEREVTASAQAYRRVRVAFQAGEVRLKGERNRRYVEHQKLVARYRYLKARTHDFHQHRFQQGVAARLRERLHLAYEEGTTNPYLLLGATKEVLQRVLDEVAGPGGGARDRFLSVEDAIMLANVRDVLKSAAARESIDQYVATKRGGERR